MVEITTLQTLPPLQGCLICHREGTMKFAEGRKVLGLGSGLPSVSCAHCGAMAQLELGENGNAGAWRIRYKKISDAPVYYYVRVYFGQSRWYGAEEALEISTRGFVQRHRLDQVQRGDLSWLQPTPLVPPPPLMAPSERVYLSVNEASLQIPAQGGGLLATTEATVLDTGAFYVTNSRVHLIGQKRDWANRLNEIRDIEHDEHRWRIFVGANRQCFAGDNAPQSLDAQLFAAVVKVLWKDEI